MSPVELLTWASERFGSGLVCLSALGAEDCVLVDVIARAKLPIPILSIDTAVLFRETYALWSRLEKKYGIKYLSADITWQEKSNDDGNAAQQQIEKIIQQGRRR